MPLRDNAIVLVDGSGQEIYLTEIDYYVSEYIDTLPDADMIFKPKTFIGLLDYLYEHIVKDLPYRSRPDRQMLDYRLIEDLFFKVYKVLCSRFDKTPTIIGFCSFLRIDNANMTDVRHGYYRTSGRAVNRDATQTIQKIYDACQSATLSSAIDGNSIGSIFACKACYGMSDQPKPQMVGVHEADSRISIEEIKERYGNTLIEQPEPPIFDD